MAYRQPPTSSAQPQSAAAQTCTTRPDGTQKCQPRRSFAYYLLPSFISGGASANRERSRAAVPAGRIRRQCARVAGRGRDHTPAPQPQPAAYATSAPPPKPQSAALTSNARTSTPTVSASGTTRDGFGTTAQSNSFRRLRGRIDCMQRIACDERPDWKDKAAEAGFRFHTIAGERYWDERAYYAFTLKQIERDIEAPTAELDAMCRELVARAVDDERMLQACCASRSGSGPSSRRAGSAAIRASMDASICRYDGQGPAKLLEYNADTPTSVFETAVFQWMWLEDAIDAQRSCRAMPTSTTRCTSG